MSDYIPEGIIVQILKCLPVETLVRFRCVCKGWKQLIDSPSLVVAHLAVQKPRFSGMNRYYAKPEFLVLDPQTLPLLNTLSLEPFDESRINNLILTGTLHGIVCLYEYYSMESGIFLWNPSMRKLLNVPLPKDMHYYRDDDPTNCRHIPSTYSAFWIDPFTKGFKIIVFKMVYTYRKESEKYGAIYSSIEGNWKELSLGEIGNYLLYGEDPAVVMGKVAYWRVFYRVQPSHEIDFRFYRAVVISFDFEQERFDIIEGPSVLYGCPSCHPSLRNWQGSLSLVYLDLEKRCDIYLRREEGSWVNLFRFNLTPNISQVLCILEQVGERVPREEMQEKCKILAITTEDELITFDTRAGCLHLKSGDEPFYDGFMAYDLVESLLFPYG